ncbi:hypothetical protein GME_08329 [Halomonas sp. TD01]|nr:hypothetical protein GME_08329 [Halomonas sp. TD01]
MLETVVLIVAETIAEIVITFLIRCSGTEEPLPDATVYTAAPSTVDNSN